MPDAEGHPEIGEMDLGSVFAALADPLRRKVVSLRRDDLQERFPGLLDLVADGSLPTSA
ncbi:hypothetical protein [Streptomyces sp. NPDC088733]|uniref:hypothetical protein n=1 Tax=Streptomyces sp. NPDC088733 TaxID=3365880 RepID=UPI00382F395D